MVQMTVTSAYTREAEREADTDAVALLNGSGIDGSGLVDFFERMRKKQGGDPQEVQSVLSSHPSSGERSDFVRDNSTGHGPAMLAPQWRALQDICDKK
jgi:predicted Zn-dependent protease